MAQRELRRSKDKMLLGVVSGMAEYLDIDTTLTRIIYAVLTLSSMGTGVLVYIIAALLMKEPDE